MTQAEFARKIGVTQPVISDLMSRGILVRGGSFDEWLLAYCAHLRDVAAGRQAAEGDDEAAKALTVEKTRLTKAQADKTEIEVAELEGKLVKIEAVEQEFGDMVASARTRILAIPGRAASRVMAAANLKEANRILTDLCHEVLAELARDGHDSDDVSEDESSATPSKVRPTAKANAKPVGKRKAQTQRRG